MSTLLVENIRHEDASAPTIVLQSDGRLGIGTTTPAAGVDFVGVGDINITGVSGGATLNIKSGDNYVAMGWNRNTSNGAIYDSGTSAYQMQLNNAGDFELQAYNGSGTFLGFPLYVANTSINVGIGTNTPAKTLDVAGEVSATDYHIDDSLLPSTQPRLKLSPYNTDAFSFNRNQNDVVSFVDKNGSIGYTNGQNPRVTHDPLTGECLGIIIEDSGSQFLWDTDMMNNWSLGATGDTFSMSSHERAPDGGYCRLYAASSNTGIHRLHRGVTIDSATGEYYASCFFKRGNGTDNRYIEIEVSGNFSNHTAVTFDLQDKVHTVNTGNCYNISMEEFPGGWIRCGYGFKDPGTTSGTIWFGVCKTFGADVSTTFDGTNNFFMWGANVTKHNTPNANPRMHSKFYVPNNSGAGPYVTRYTAQETFTLNEETIKKGFSGWDGLDFSFVLDFVYRGIPSSSTNYYLFTLNGDNGRYFGLRIDNGQSGGLNFQHRLENLNYLGSTINTGTAQAPGSKIRLAARITANEWVGYINGTQRLNMTTNMRWATDLYKWSSINIGGSGQPMASGIFRSLEFYDEILTNDQLQYLSNYRGYADGN